MLWLAWQQQHVEESSDGVGLAGENVEKKKKRKERKKERKH
jgi:hypothetical protein